VQKQVPLGHFAMDVPEGSFSAKKIASLANVTLDFVNKIKKELKMK
jgi:hypothetical protein